ncbi:MAG: WD40 repeat domain-containing protein [Candidatus Endonucleobacter bathymodioli]|uniref:WD40 repeat domain-containing protein n=1 Tax=Candidatus Endonucleibacter bathymodioli TaxID=539814 RepID=A0AA90NMJ3_9GAMM|nr:WD40 repeat domain-containing protein [Candidatus Endonucleobacter bathymodioli]
MKMIRLFIVTLAIVLSGASMPSLGGLPKKIQEQKTDDEAVGECYRLFKNLSLEKPTVCSTMPDVKADTEALVKDGLAITLEFKEENALNDSAMATNNGDECNVVQNNEVVDKLLRNTICPSYTVDSTLMVDHETSMPSESLVSKLVGSGGYNCNDEDCVLSFSSDSCYLLTTGKNNTLIIWTTEDEDEDEEWRKDITIVNDAAVSSAYFSPDSCYMVAHTSVGVKVYIREGDKWKENGTISVTAGATFSPDSRHLVIYNKEWIEILILGMDGVIGAVHESTHKDVESAYFTINSSYLILTVDNEPRIVFSRENDGRWERKASIPSNGKDTLLTATIWNDDLYMVATSAEGNTGKVTIFRLEMDGKWVEKAMFTASIIYAVGTSIDGIHILTKDDLGNSKSLAKIWSLVEEEVLIGKDILNDKKDVDNDGCIGDPGTINRGGCQAEFSNDGRHVAILSDDMLILCSQNEYGDWIEVFASEEKRSIRSFTFSIDSTNMIVIPLKDCAEKNTFILWRMGRSGKWSEENISYSNDDRVSSISFSDDGCNKVMAYANGNIKIWGEKAGGEQWRAKDCVTGSSVDMVIFSPDSRYVASIGGGHVVKLFGLDGVNLYGLPQCSKSLIEVFDSQAAEPAVPIGSKRLKNTMINHFKSLVGFKDMRCVIL